MATQKYYDAGEDAPENVTPENLCKLANGGDEVAVAVWDKVATYLGNCLMSTIYLLNPDAIVIGGGVAHARDILFNPLNEKLKNSLTKECFDDLTLSHARFGNTAGIIGCSTMARERVTLELSSRSAAILAVRSACKLLMVIFVVMIFWWLGG